MLTGLEIILERMKTNPEEFVEGGYSKWSRVLDAGWAVMTEDERQALQAGMNEAKRDHFNGEVMKVLAQGHDNPVTMDSYQENRIYKGKALMQGDYSQNLAKSLITSTTALKQQVQETLEKQFDEAYARNDQQTMKTASKLKGMMKK